MLNQEPENVFIGLQTVRKTKKRVKAVQESQYVGKPKQVSAASCWAHTCLIKMGDSSYPPAGGMGSAMQGL